MKFEWRSNSEGTRGNPWPNVVWFALVVVLILGLFAPRQEPSQNGLRGVTNGMSGFDTSLEDYGTLRVKSQEIEALREKICFRYIIQGEEEDEEYKNLVSEHDSRVTDYNRLMREAGYRYADGEEIPAGIEGLKKRHLAYEAYLNEDYFAAPVDRGITTH